MKQAIKQFIKRSILGTARMVGYRNSENKIVQQSKQFWEDTDKESFRAYSHLKGEKGLSDSTWLELGRQHRQLFDMAASATSLSYPLERIIEWGCGGGSNAISFAPIAKEFVGADVSQFTLDECGKTLSATGVTNFIPRLIDLANPEAAAVPLMWKCDLFLCTYVMELVPTPEYGKRIVDIAFSVLRPGALAMIQIKYSTASPSTRPRRWGYKHNAANMTTYPIHTFWELTQSAGFEPLFIHLKPRQELVGDERYAYFILRKPV